jgi:hypothetical protein
MSTSNADVEVFNHGIESPDTTVLFNSKKYVEVIDSQSTGGNYASELNFDLTALQSQSNAISFEDALIQWPVIGRLRNITAGGTPPTIDNTKFMAYIKSGWHQMINSVSLKLGGKNIAEEHDLTNLKTSFKIMSEWNDEELQRWGPMLGISKDVLATGYNTTLVSIKPTTNPHGFNTMSAAANNPGATQRLTWMLNEGASEAFNALNSTKIGSAAGLTTYKFKGSVVATGAVEFEFCALACVRLKDICPVVEYLPLIKNCTGNLKIKLNAAKTTINTDPSNVITFSHEVYRGNSNPSMITTCTGLGPSSKYEFTIESGANNTIASPQAFKYARLLVASYDPNPASESVLMANKSIRYTKTMHTQFDVASGQNFNEILTSGVENPRRLILIPIATVDSSSAPTDLANPLNSPFDSAGATSSPFVSIQGLNVRVGNRSLFNDPVSVNSEFFFSQLKTGVSGTMESGMVSGQITSYDFDSLYRFYPFNIGRRTVAEDGSKFSLSVSGKNNSTVRLTIHSFYEYEQDFKIDPTICKLSE